MTKFTMVTCFAGTENIDGKSQEEIEAKKSEIEARRQEIIDKLKEAYGEDFAQVNILDISGVSKETLVKFLDMGAIDCFAFTPDAMVSMENREKLIKTLVSEITSRKNVKYLSMYDGTDPRQVEMAHQVGEVVLGKPAASIQHVDMFGNPRIAEQNLKGVKNAAIHERERLVSREHDILEFTKNAVETLRERDEYSANHVKSVSLIATQIAERLEVGQNGEKMTPEQVEILRLGALLHDIGKIDVSDGVLHAPNFSTLTKEQRDSIVREMRNHEVFGEIELNQYDFGEFEVVKEIAANHHERYDGKGYPRGLKGDEISIYARILSLADSVQAMCGRFYAQSKTKEELIQELQRCAGTQFDPEVAQVCCDVIEHSPEAIGLEFDENGKMVRYEVPDINSVIEEAKKNLDNMEARDVDDENKEEGTPTKPENPDYEDR